MAKFQRNEISELFANNKSGYFGCAVCRGLAVFLALALLVSAGCARDKDSGKSGETFVPDYTLAPIADWQLERQQSLLRWVCDQPLYPNSMDNLLIHLECESRFDDYSVAEGSVADDAWDADFEKIYSLRDTSDFTMTRILNLMYAFAGHPAASEALWDKTKQAILDFKYWYTDPTPDRTIDGEKVADNMWYWSENHTMIFHVCEYLAGQMFPDEVFTVSGLTGAEQMERVRPKIIQWFEERARWGFTEWHSDVYYNWDMHPLLALVEWSNDEELAYRAAMLLDLVWLDVAVHLHRGTFGATHGRSYIKDKPAADLEDIFNQAKMFFDDTSLDYNGSSVFARARKYAMPEVIREIARDDSPMIDRERMNLDLPEEPPATADEPLPEAPYGLSYEDEQYLPLWWSMSGMVAWPVIPLTLRVANREQLWDTQFKSFGIVKDLVGDLQDPQQIREVVYPVYSQLWKVITGALIEQVNTYTYRNAHYMLSTAQDYRHGIQGMQHHIWQATLDERAVVFSNHPANLATPNATSSATDYDWHSDEPGPGYWTGEGSQPKAVQHENVGIIITAPQFEPAPLGLTNFNYLDETHAYFPVAHFDEVRRAGNWTFGRKGESFIGLYSHRPVDWRTTQPEVYLNDGKPFDLVAAGAASNAWIVELGSGDDYESFDAFVAALSAAQITITPLADRDSDGFDDGYDVVYKSPSQGEMSVGWHSPLVVAGEQIPVHDYDRYNNPYLHTAFDNTRYEISAAGRGLLLDFSRPQRLAH